MNKVYSQTMNHALRWSGSCPRCLSRFPCHCVGSELGTIAVITRMCAGHRSVPCATPVSPNQFTRYGPPQTSAGRQNRNSNERAHRAIPRHAVPTELSVVGRTDRTHRHCCLGVVPDGNASRGELWHMAPHYRPNIDRCARKLCRIEAELDNDQTHRGRNWWRCEPHAAASASSGPLGGDRRHQRLGGHDGSTVYHRQHGLDGC